MQSEHAWIHINTRKDDDPVTLSISINSLEDALVVEIDPDDWSKMLATHGQPVNATVRWMPRSDPR